MISKCSQRTATCAEGRAPRVGTEAGPDWVVLEGVGLTARVKVRIGRGFHRSHARIVGIQVRVIHFVHGEAARQTLKRVLFTGENEVLSKQRRGETGT